MSIGQDPRWRRFLVSRINAIPGSWVLDVATGTGLVARELARRRNVHVVGLDQSEDMLLRGASGVAAVGLRERVSFVRGRGEALPFPDGAFDGLTFTYLLRYVDDPAQTLRELSRVLRPGGVMAGLEFFVPVDPYLRAGWKLYTRTVLPAVGWLSSPAWFRTGRFLGPNIEDFYRRFPLPTQVGMWQEAGISHIRTRVMTLGAAVVTWGIKRRPGSDG
jgi:demethylmenaquinone methyltransferase/2-methoxy-6-polyprenyl-1,4-benzoquinol methylase